MLKIYEIQNVDLRKLAKEQKLILSGKNDLIEINEFFEIWKVLKTYEMKLIAFIQKSKKILVIESIACFPSKTEIQKMMIEFNTALKKEKINFVSVYDKNNY